jgi:hypothetical protein
MCCCHVAHRVVNEDRGLCCCANLIQNQLETLLVGLAQDWLLLADNALAAANVHDVLKTVDALQDRQGAAQAECRIGLGVSTRTLE